MAHHLLALETATAVCSVAVFSEQHCRALLTLDRPRQHAERLVPMVEQALAYAGLSVEAMEAVAVSAGPGSYTGLRIGVSTAKGLALATDAALIGVSSLAALAEHATLTAPAGTAVVAARKARRSELYAAAYRVSPNRALETVAPPAALTTDGLAAWWEATGLDDTCWAVGDAAASMQDALPDVPFHVLPFPHIGPDARTVGRRALHRLARGETDDMAMFEPYYLKAYHAKKHEG